MSEKISLKEAEEKVFNLTIQDGLWDILIGCFLLEFALAPLLSQNLGDFWSSAIFLPFWCLVYLAIFITRKYIVKPRMGEVKFGKARRIKLIKSSLVMLIVNILALIAGIIVALNYLTIPARMPSIFLGFIFLIVLSLLAFFLEYNRLYVYGLLAGFSPMIGEWLYSNYGATHHGFPVTFGITSGIIILTGVIVFVRFLSSNPIINIEASHNDQSIV